MTRRLICLRFLLMSFFFPLVDLTALTDIAYAYPLQFDNSSVDSFCLTFLTRSRLVLLLRTYVIVSCSLLYIWLEMRTRSSSSIYFATTLKV